MLEFARRVPMRASLDLSPRALRVRARRCLHSNGAPICRSRTQAVRVRAWSGAGMPR